MRALDTFRGNLEPFGSAESTARAAVLVAPAAGGDGMELFRKLWRHRGLVVGVTLAAVIVAALATVLMKPRYSAVSQVLVGIAEPNVANIPAVLKNIEANEETVQSEGYILQSRGLADQVVRRLALDQDPEFNPSLRQMSLPARVLHAAKDFVDHQVAEPVLIAIGQAPKASRPLSADERARRTADAVTSNLMDRIDVTPLKRSHVLSIDAQSENPEIAARIANTLADVYIEQQMVRKARAAQHATGWLDQQIAGLRQQVEQSERAVEEYRRQNGLYQTKVDTVTSQQVNELNTQLILAESEKATAEARLVQAKRVLHDPKAIDTLPQVVNSPLVQALKEKQVEMERNLAELSATYGPEHPKLLNLKAQLRDVRGKIAIEIKKVVDALQHEAQAAEARYQSLHGNLQKLQTQMGVMNDKAIRLRELERQAEANRTLLNNFLDRSKQTTAQEGMAEPDATVISKASVPLRPSFPPTGMILLLGMVGGGLLGSLMALFFENLDRTFRTGEQVERATRLPALGMVPAARMRERLVGLSRGHATSPFNDSIRNLHTRLMMSGSDQPPKVIMFTSAAPHEGKSRITVAMARLAAHTGRRVILVDCDWQRPVLHTFFRRSVGPGVADLLSGDAKPEESVYRDQASGVHAIFAGNLARLDSDPQRFARLRLLLQTLAKHYDLVIVDSPPVLVGSEVMPLGRMMDRVAFVVKWGSTPREVVLNGLKQMFYARAKVAGVVLTQIDPKRYRRYGMGEITYPYRRPDIVRMV
jgi:succinoglycan biosynthesis transport protein ExoP